MDNSTVKTENSVFEKIESFISEIIGEDFIDEYDVSMTSVLTNDLEMESIEIVELSEKIKNHYGEGVNFTEWMSNLELENIISLSVGDVVKYIEECQS